MAKQTKTLTGDPKTTEWLRHPTKPGHQQRAVMSGHVYIETRSTPPDDSFLSRRLATMEELENAEWLLDNPAGLIASALHGGQAEGFVIAMGITDRLRLRTAMQNLREREGL